MSNQAVANRYAVALFQLAQSKGTLEKTGEELEIIQSVIKSTPELVKTINHPKVTLVTKKELVRKSFSGQVGADVLHTLLLLLERQRFSIVSDLSKAFTKLHHDLLNIADAMVYSAKPLTDEELKQVELVFAPKAGKSRLIATNKVDKELVGGVKIRIGDRIYDGSIKGQLNRLERNLLAGNR
ncbi:F0F1 ATP synthase subunit delta [Alkalicoccobacillus plakortidis]|uniref:ATP synthase subunit delta n=1 Tax=Alkalicoccobacillus plakortidis TaxID=444060 RepID=A0ABT0XL53_9BACI|nr:F0F1 ATP synthase subunit delta [Alkalicoccobacillus plakortidis]MCM2675959.1 F0F1 ATP synthase subunit delta [Alkalicoccobacillus plakortidis]